MKCFFWVATKIAGCVYHFEDLVNVFLYGNDVMESLPAKVVNSKVTFGMPLHMKKLVVGCSGVLVQLFVN